MQDKNEIKVTIKENNFSIIDEYSESLIIDPYIRSSDQTERVQIYLDSQFSEIRDLMEKTDIKIDLPKENLAAFLNTVLIMLDSKESEAMVLSDRERKIVLASRNGANIAVNWFNQTIEEAELKVSAFGKTYKKESVSGMETKWITTNKTGFSDFEAAAFYR